MVTYSHIHMGCRWTPSSAPDIPFDTISYFIEISIFIKYSILQYARGAQMDALLRSALALADRRRRPSPADTSFAGPPGDAGGGDEAAPGPCAGGRGPG